MPPKAAPKSKHPTSTDDDVDQSVQVEAQDVENGQAGESKQKSKAVVKASAPPLDPEAEGYDKRVAKAYIQHRRLLKQARKEYFAGLNDYKVGRGTVWAVNNAPTVERLVIATLILNSAWSMDRDCNQQDKAFFYNMAVWAGASLAYLIKTGSSTGVKFFDAGRFLDYVQIERRKMFTKEDIKKISSSLFDYISLGLKVGALALTQKSIMDATDHNTENTLVFLGSAVACSGASSILDFAKNVRLAEHIALAPYSKIWVRVGESRAQSGSILFSLAAFTASVFGLATNNTKWSKQFDGSLLAGFAAIFAATTIFPLVWGSDFLVKGFQKRYIGNAAAWLDGGKWLRCIPSRTDVLDIMNTVLGTGFVGLAIWLGRQRPDNSFLPVSATVIAGLVMVELLFEYMANRRLKMAADLRELTLNAEYEAEVASKKAGEDEDDVIDVSVPVPQARARASLNSDTDEIPYQAMDQGRAKDSGQPGDVDGSVPPPPTVVKDDDREDEGRNTFCKGLAGLVRSVFYRGTKSGHGVPCCGKEATFESNPPERLVELRKQHKPQLG